MTQVTIELDILGRPGTNCPVYRIIAEGDLIVERTYTCPPENFIHETLLVNVEGKGQHVFYIESPGNNLKDTFEFRNVTVNGREWGIDDSGKSHYIVS